MLHSREGGLIVQSFQHVGEIVYNINERVIRCSITVRVI